MDYTVSMKVDARVDVNVSADSFEEAFELAMTMPFDPALIETVEFVPVNATDERGRTEDYDG